MTVMFLMTGTLKFGWVFRQNDRIEVRMKNTERSEMHWKKYSMSKWLHIKLRELNIDTEKNL